jgi:nucleoside-diphosphate-sugar epimerase
MSTERDDAAGGGTVLITGGRGFVGRWAVDRLVAAGRRVVTYDRDPWDGKPGVTAVHGELHDLPRLLRTIGDNDVRTVVHTAGISHPDVSIDQPVATFFANTMGSVNVFEAARLAGIDRVVNFSTSSVYGHQDGRVEESVKPSPITPYGVSKLAAEQLGGVYRSLYGLDVVSLRVFWVYGPGNRMPEYTRDIVTAVLRGDGYRIESGADHPLPLVHVDDVARAAILAVDCEAPAGGVYNVIGPDRPTLGELGDLVARLVPGAQIEIGPGDLHLHRLADVDSSAAASELGFEPQWRLERGLEDYVEWLRSHDA